MVLAALWRVEQARDRGGLDRFNVAFVGVGIERVAARHHGIAPLVIRKGSIPVLALLTGPAEREAEVEFVVRALRGMLHAGLHCPKLRLGELENLEIRQQVPGFSTGGLRIDRLLQ